MEEFSQSAAGESHLLQRTIHKRMALIAGRSSIADNTDKVLQREKIGIVDPNCSQENFLELSNLNTVMANSYIDSIRALKCLAQSWEEKYIGIKTATEKTRQQLQSEQNSMNRTVSKLKSLADNYKSSLEEA